MQKVYHITWTTYNSRVSERMKLYKVKSDNQEIYLNSNQEYDITVILSNIINEWNLQIYAYNICADHIHMVIQCEVDELSIIMRRIKGKSVKLYKDLHNIDSSIHLWGQKYNAIIIENKEQLLHTIKYIKNNRIKHWLVRNKEVENIDFCKKIRIHWK